MNKNKGSIKREAEKIVNIYFPKRKKKKDTEMEKDDIASEEKRLVEEKSFPQKEFNVNCVNADPEILLLKGAEEKINDDFSGSSERSIRDQLAECFVQHNVPATTANAILRILKPVIPNLPTDVRTLKGTPRDVPLISMDGGKYVHYGITDSLTDFVRHNNVQSDYLELNFNVDGLPIAKSSGAQVWPILMNVSSSEAVFAIGVYQGYTKPKNSNE